MTSESTHQPPPWVHVDEEELGRYPIFRLVRAVRRSPATDRDHPFLRIDAPDWVNVIALTADRGELVLVEQFRHGTDAVTVEIPGGAVDPGETPLEAAVRELEEETGYRPRDVHEIGWVEPNPAFLSNRCWTFLAVGCTPDGDAAPDPSEDIRVRTVPLAAFDGLLDDGTIRHALVVAARDHLERGVRQGAPWTRILPLRR